VKYRFNHGARPPQQITVLERVPREPLWLSALRVVATSMLSGSSFKPHRVAYGNGQHEYINLSPIGKGYYNDMPIDVYSDEYGLMYMETYNEGNGQTFRAIINNETDEQMTYDEFMETYAADD
jgi:hypothetical protein